MAGVRLGYGQGANHCCNSAFDTYVAAFDRQLVEAIHDAGGRVWVHCHGKMRPVIERFADMGVDVLNPTENGETAGMWQAVGRIPPDIEGDHEIVLVVD